MVALVIRFHDKRRSWGFGWQDSKKIPRRFPLHLVMIVMRKKARVSCLKVKVEDSMTGKGAFYSTDMRFLVHNYLLHLDNSHVQTKYDVLRYD